MEGLIQEDRRKEDKGRRIDDHRTCLWHGDGVKKMDRLEETIKCLNRKILGMTRLIYTGVGIALCGAVLITIVFTSIGVFKGEVRADMNAYEMRIEKRYDEMHDEIMKIGGMVRDIHAERKIRSAIEEARRVPDPRGLAQASQTLEETKENTE